MWLRISGVFSLEKYGKILENRPFFRVDTDRLGKFSMGDLAGSGSKGLNVEGLLCP